MALKFSPEVRLGELLGAGGAIVAVALAFGNLTSEIAVVKQGQASQADASRRSESNIMSNIREVKDEVRDTGTRVRSLESRMDRARM